MWKKILLPVVSFVVLGCAPEATKQPTVIQNNAASFPQSVNGSNIPSASPTIQQQNSLNILAGTYTGTVYHRVTDEWDEQPLTAAISFTAQQTGQLTLKSEGYVFGGFTITAPIKLVGLHTDGTFWFTTNILTSTPIYSGSMVLMIGLRLNGSSVDAAQSNIYAYDCINPEGMSCSVAVDGLFFTLSGKI
jgi:hypothetical protein